MINQMDNNSLLQICKLHFIFNYCFFFQKINKGFSYYNFFFKKKIYL